MVYLFYELVLRRVGCNSELMSNCCQRERLSGPEHDASGTKTLASQITSSFPDRRLVFITAGKRGALKVVPYHPLVASTVYGPRNNPPGEERNETPVLYKFQKPVSIPYSVP